MSFRVLSPGTFSLLVGAARTSYRAYGIPLGGPADRRSRAIANALLGNEPSATTLEISLSGPVLQAECDMGIALYGGRFDVWIDEQAHSHNAACTIRVGQTLRIGACRSGCRAYLAVMRGFQIPMQLASHSAWAPIAVGDLLQADRSQTSALSYGEEIPEFTEIRCLPGPQRAAFGTEFFDRFWQVSPASNRMGIRLQGDPLPGERHEIASEPVAPGAVQITNDGRPIVLGVDGQTIGGYPKVAHVVDEDLDKLGQLRPQQKIRFREITPEQITINSRQAIHSEYRRVKFGSRV